MAVDDYDYDTIDCEVIETTTRAVLIDLGDRTQWVPRSVIMHGANVAPFQRDLEIKSWFCEKEGIY